ncbi:MacB family efflux pump subunit [uncultured Aquitalea sp.]|uniref:MacB family efflux pump subunit n=1 Tax=uncultured Aquitalea sp. TaxID=540272 RepID=UPI0025ED1697|nr:MacB family efflux pump subunit [uncultured Aquitalea sp.]
MAEPLLSLNGVGRDFAAGEETVAVLSDIRLDIMAGEMVAIMGASGSGKSTLMNLLGCLDTASRGSYRVAGADVSAMTPDQLARLRREHFGFIFQRYHLLGELSARENAELPAVYAGVASPQRRERALRLLARLGLAGKAEHKPSQLSGGQQQRVSIARALMNGGKVILADEPTGALDSVSGQQVMAILRELHAEGHTIILVTHDSKVAEHAERIIEIGDGKIIADRRRETALAAAAPSANLARAESRSWREGCVEAFRMAWQALMAHRLRSALTMLGIIIGIASVVSVVALGNGSSQRILQDISALGTNTINIYPGKHFGDRKADAIHTLTPRDAAVLAEQGFVDSVTPEVSDSVTLRYHSTAVTAQVKGVGEQYFRVRGVSMASGAAFDADAVSRQAQRVVIDENTRKSLFPDQDPIGKIILLGRLPCRVIGVAQTQKTAFGNDENLNLWLPYTTVMYRLLGQDYLKAVTVRIADNTATDAAEASLVALMTRRHGTQDFFVMNTDSIRQTIQSATATMTLLVSMIAVISLVVGGIGVMNIMLVSVSERTREIGVCMAVGARQRDILQQFLIEAVMVCLIGGVMGVGLSLLFGLLAVQAGSFSMVFSWWSIAAAFGCATLIGVLFGYLPARNAARLDPVAALSRE